MVDAMESNLGPYRNVMTSFEWSKEIVIRTSEEKATNCQCEKNQSKLLPGNRRIVVASGLSLLLPFPSVTVHCSLVCVKLPQESSLSKLKSFECCRD